MNLKKTVVFLSIFLLVSMVAQAHLVKTINLEQLVDLSAYIVKAKVASKQIDKDEYESGSMVVYYTLTVDEWLKGDAPAGMEKTLIIKQLANGEYTAGPKTIRQNLGLPEYDVGETYLFFLPEPHPSTGLLAPIGLFQGVYQIKKSVKTGAETVPAYKTRANILKKGLVKHAKNKFVTKQLSAAALGADYSYDSFKSMIQTIVGE